MKKTLMIEELEECENPEFSKKSGVSNFINKPIPFTAIV
jgi:hypothetical protein